MPRMQRMIEVANHMWRPENIDNIQREWFDSPPAMHASYHGALARGNDLDVEVARSIPLGLLEMLRALYLYNLDGPRLGIQFAWMPGYDWELTVAECPGTSDSPGAITVLIRGRYPRDPHPASLR